MTAFKCSTKFGEFTIPPDELELLEEDDEELEDPPDELELLEEEELLELDEEELLELDEEAIQTGILHSWVVLLWQQGMLFTGQVNVSLIPQSGIDPEEQYVPLVQEGTIQFGVLACPVGELLVMQYGIELTH